jgi:small-conductance mechanosensitive channel
MRERDSLRAEVERLRENLEATLSSATALATERNEATRERDRLRAELDEARREVVERIDEANRLDAARDQDMATIANLKVWNNQLRDEVASWRAWCSKTLGHGSWDSDGDGRALLDAKLAAAKAGVVFTEDDVRLLRCVVSAPWGSALWSATSVRALADRLSQLVQSREETGR